MLNSIKAKLRRVPSLFGLGRYGDPLDPYRTEKAIEELKRIVCGGGALSSFCKENFTKVPINWWIP
jgi:hypothetical protein